MCGYCGKEAQGFATINDVRYCHPDEGQDCYQLARRPSFPPLTVRNGVVSAKRLTPFEWRIR